MKFLELIPGEKIDLPSHPLKGKFSIEEGKVYGIIGQNGIGKTSFFRYLKSEKEKIFKKPVSFIDQVPLRPLVDLDVKNFCLLFFKELAPLMGERFSPSSSVFKNLGINKIWNQRVSQLSGGENQLLKASLAFCLDVPYYLFDEPLQSLSRENQAIISSEILKLKKQKKTILIIEHNRDFLQGIADENFEFVLRKKDKSLELRSYNG